MRSNYVVLSTVLGLAMVAGCKSEVADSPSPPEVVTSPVDQGTGLDQATGLYQRGLSAEALKLVQQALIASPNDTRALRLAAGIHESLSQPCEAAEFWLQLVDAEPQRAVASLIRAFDLHLRCGEFAAAESDLERAIQLDGSDPQPRRLLAQLFNAQGRRYEASEHVRELIRLRVIQPNELSSLVDLSGPFALVSYDGVVDTPPTSLFSLGEARYLHVAQHHDPDQVLAILDRVVQKYPDSTAAAAFQGRLLAEIGQRDKFVQWHSQLPEGIEQQPEYWNAMGHYLALEDRHQEAIRAFAEAIRLDPTDRSSLRTMANSLEQIGRESDAITVRQKLAVLDEIFHTALNADASRALWISEKLNELTRPWESAAWLMYSARLSGTLQQRVAELDARGKAITTWEQAATPDQIRDAKLKKLLGFDAKQLPLPSIGQSNPEVKIAEERLSRDIHSAMRFDDVAAKSGLRTKFESGFPVDGGPFFAYQVNGGGLAVLDYDLDGFSDVYIVQSGGKPNDPTGSIANQLYRLRDGQHFLEVTATSESGDRGFGQGVCAGDVNQDGFIDLLVANIGKNRLLLNQGDGTFRDATDLMTNNKDRWTSCLGLADLDGDGLPEIIEVNYIDDPMAYEVVCDDDHLPCQPQRFKSASDDVLRANPDGSYVAWSTNSRFDQTTRLGFGLVIANFDRQFGNDFFIANDGNMNHFWTSVTGTSTNGRKFDVVETAVARGCAIGRSGDSQACMGVASGDLNRDGTLDLHVTNFTGESVNLFLQTSSGFFTDEARKYGLHEPSFDVLGFGTQANDFDNDGWLDLAVLNGHVYDARRDNIAYKMQPQLFGGDQFGFLPIQNPDRGEYWKGERLGRTLAMLDWNRDGRVDLLANHLDAPVALLENDSPKRQWMQLELVGVTSERDAIGAEVRVVAGSQTFTAWQIGGDGYMCSNEPMIHFGLADCQTIDAIEVVWPSGTMDRFENVEPNHRYLVIEGERTLEVRFRSAGNAG